MRKVLVAVLMFLSAETIHAGTSDLSWAGLSANTGYLDNPYGTDVYQDGAEAEANSLGLGLIRMGMDSMGGSTYGAPLSFAHRDRRVDSHLQAGLKIHSVISYHAVSKGNNLEDWKRNYRWFVSEVFRHYNGKIFYYIIDNETDLRSGESASIAVEMTKVAYEEAKKVSAQILIESPPTSNPSTGYLKQMIDLGITRYCDVVGVHNYGTQVLDTHGQSIKFPYIYQKEAQARSGYPVRPVASSESGTSKAWVNWARPEEYKARWFQLNYIQLKRYGYNNVLLYSLNSTVPDRNFDISDWDDNSKSWVRIQPTWSAVQSSYDKNDFANGGFELANNRFLEWAIYYNVDQEFPPEWNRAKFLTDGRGRSGQGYLYFTSDRNIVRRVVANLTPGKAYTIDAYTKGRGTLKALGYNRLDGTEEKASSNTVLNEWQKLSVTFTPSNPWVVISLEGDGEVYFDDVAFSGQTPSTTPTPVPPNGRPDLVVTEIRPVSATAGSSVLFTATIKNQGTVASPSGTIHGVGFVVDNVSVGYNDLHTSSIPAGGQVTLTMSSRPWTAVSGSHTLTAYVDDINRIPNESDESNNTRTITFTVSAGAANLRGSEARLTAPMQVFGSGDIGTTRGNSGSAVFTTPSLAGGAYTLTADVIAPSESKNSFYVQVGTASRTVWHIPVSTTRRRVTFGTITLTNGVSTITIHGREVGTQLQAIQLTPN